MDWKTLNSKYSKSVNTVPTVSTVKTTLPKKSGSWDELNSRYANKKITVQTPIEDKPSLLKSALYGVGNIIKNTAVGLYNQFTNPEPDIKQAESLLTLKSNSKLANAIATPNTLLVKGFVRLFGPMVNPLAKDIGEIYFTNELTKQINEGKMPVTALNDIEVLKKTTPQIVGDVSQAVLAMYMPKFSKEAISQGEKSLLSGFLSGAKTGASTGTMFGVSQVLSSGSEDPKEIANIMAQNIIGLSTLGGVTGGLGSVIGKIGKAEKIVTDPKIKEVLTETKNIVKNELNTVEILKNNEQKVNNDIKILSEDPVFESTSFKEQAIKYNELLNQDRANTLDIATGKKPAPQGVDASAVAKLFSKDKNLTIDEALRLTESPYTISKAGQELSLSRIAGSNDPVGMIKEVIRQREKSFEGKTGQKTVEVKKVMEKSLKDTIRKSQPRLKDWTEFIESIKC